MTRRDRRLVLALAALGAAIVLAAGGIAAAVWVTLDAQERTLLAAVLQPRIAIASLAALVVFALAGLVLHRLFDRYVQAPAGLLGQVRVLLHGNGRRDLPREGSAENRGLAQAIASLLEERDRLRDDMARRVAEASQDIEQQRRRLAALMSELTQSVVVCNLEGRILLYNQRARLQLGAMSNAGSPGAGVELIGLGRSIYPVLDRPIIAHALEGIRSRLQRLQPEDAAPSSQFVTTTPAGRLLRVQMAAVLAPADPDSGAGAVRDHSELDGFVLMAEDITREFEQDAQRDELLHTLTEGSRASLANLQAAVEMLDFPDLDLPQRERFLAVVREEVGALAERVRRVAADAALRSKTRWPLEDMLGAELVAAAQRRIESHPGLRADASDVDRSLWLKVDSFALLQALAHLAGRLQECCGVSAVRLMLTAAEPGARLDLAWHGPAPDSAALASWQCEAMRIDGQGLSLSLGDVVERHGGEFWLERGAPGEDAFFFRFLLPVAENPGETQVAQLQRHEARPEFYDFDLFRTSPQSRRLDDTSLADLSYTVFDTETTGLDPAGGDEIIQIGATRIVNGRLLRTECFDQLVDPQRAITPASSRIHGITPEMVRGQPTIREVLPSFHAFAADTVLVAHNAAFDMRFLEIKQDEGGVRFDQPVLDTLLLSAVVHPEQGSHDLESIAARLGIRLAGRHAALGDALATAEIFLRLLPLLGELGIRTLGQARAAARRTYYARLRY